MPFNLHTRLIRHSGCKQLAAGHIGPDWWTLMEPTSCKHTYVEHVCMCLRAGQSALLLQRGTPAPDKATAQLCSMFLSRSFNSTELPLQQLVTSTPFPQALHLQTVLRWQKLAVSRLPSRSAAKDTGKRQLYNTH